MGAPCGAPGLDRLAGLVPPSYREETSDRGKSENHREQTEI